MSSDISGKQAKTIIYSFLIIDGLSKKHYLRGKEEEADLKILGGTND